MGRLSWIVWVALPAITNALCEEGRGEEGVTTEQMLKGCSHKPCDDNSHQEPQEAKNGFPLEPPEGAWPCLELVPVEAILSLRPPKLLGAKFLPFQVTKLVVGCYSDLEK